MQIREATEADAAGLARVQVDSYRSAYAPYFPPSYLAQFSYEEQEGDWRELLLDGSDDLLYVAETETGEIAGYALVRPDGGDIPPYEAELVALHVRAADRRRGIGQALIAAVAGRLLAGGVRSMLLWTIDANPARTLYERLGGTFLGEKQSDVDGTPLTEVAYGWLDLTALSNIAGGESPAAVQ